MIKYSCVIENGKFSPIFRNEYDEKLDDFLRKRCQENGANYIKFAKSAMETTLWNIKTMMKFPYLINAIGEELGIDISNPLKSFTKED